MESWHTLEAAAAAEKLGVAVDGGLDPAEATSRLQKHGPNELIAKGAKSPLKILAEQFTSMLVILLIVAAVVSGAVLKEWVDGAVILGIVLLNAILGFRQDSSIKSVRRFHRFQC